MALAESLKKLDNKFKLLEIKDKNTEKILNEKKERELKRQVQVISQKLEEIYDLRTEIEELKIAEDESPEQVEEWGKEFEARTEHYEQVVESLTNATATIDNDREKVKTELAKQEEELRMKRRYEEEQRIEEMRLKMREQFSKKHADEKTPVAEGTDVKVKLPKLTITKFKGTSLDWMRFWNQFTAEIDSTKIAGVSKFSYLKELLDPKVKPLIDGLPFTSEGYERAKNILQTKFGKTSEVITAHVRGIMDLPTVNGSNPAKIHDFFEKLVTHVQAVETMGKLKTINGYVRLLLDRLPGIRSDLVRDDVNWTNWEFPHLVEALRLWTERNPISDERKEHTVQRKFDRTLQTRQKQWKPKSCVYCDNEMHKPLNCQHVSSTEARKQVVARKRLCFNCLGIGHRATECTSKQNCTKCGSRHHSSICDKSQEVASTMMLTTETQHVAYPVAVVKVNGIKCRALLDTGAGSSYASASLINRLGIPAARVENRKIEMMVHTAVRKIQVYNLKITNLEEDFEMCADISKVDKDVLLSLENPKYEAMVNKYRHLSDLRLNDMDNKSELPVHLVLGTSEYSRIKTATKPRIGNPGEPVAEYTRLGWTIISPGAELDMSNLFLARSATEDYDRLCSWDVLGIEDSPAEYQSTVYEDFKEQLTRSKEGWYETGLLWKVGHPTLSTNEKGSLARLSTLLKKLKRQPDLYQDYNAVIKDYLNQGIVERVSCNAMPHGKVFYIPHKAVVREQAESTKLRVVFDASAREDNRSPSLNDCLETGPSLQNLLWNVVVRNRMKPIALAGDIKKAFLQVRIRGEDRDALRFHWIKDIQTEEVETLRFSRVMFGLTQSPFLLGGTIEQHLAGYGNQAKELIEEIRRSLYVDDLISGGYNSDEVRNFKTKATEIFREAGFELHKWHSNDKELESEDADETDSEQSYAKQQLGVRPEETKLLGLHWNKASDTIAVSFPAKLGDMTKRGVLQTIASIYDPLGIVSPITLQGKLLFRELCDRGLTWDQQLPEDLRGRWKQFCGNLSTKMEMSRSLCLYREEIHSIELHAFGDASEKGISAVVYAVTQQPSGYSVGVIAARSRLAKKDTTIPRLELVSSHMAANLLENVKDALEGLPVTSTIAWIDSKVALHWIKGEGNYKQFVNNRVKKIRSKEFITWKHVPGEQNPADVGSRGCSATKLQQQEIWWKGPLWLIHKDQWPEDVTTVPSVESETEARKVKEVLATTISMESGFEDLIQRFSYKKVIRITAWIIRFKENCKSTEKRRGPLITEEVCAAKEVWIKRTQEQVAGSSEFEQHKSQLRLEMDNRGIYVCYGRLQGDYPVYLPTKSAFTEALVRNAHLTTLHGGVGLTITKIREHYWVPKLRQLTKKIVKNCFGCKRFQAVALKEPPQASLPTERTVGERPFQVIGLDYAGPLYYKKREKTMGKAYILLLTCSLTRAICLELLPDQTLERFLPTLKKFIARRGRPEKIYSDNFSTFVAAAKWIKKAIQNEAVHDFLVNNEINWRFNLSRAPWWGGQFERMVGLVKQTLYKNVGRASLTWDELADLLQDVELTLNNRPLGYVEDDVQMPVLTPNIMLFGQPNITLEETNGEIDDRDLRRRARYLNECKKKIWNRWSNEYIRGLRERHNLLHHGKTNALKIGDVMMIKGDEKNRGHWKLGIVKELITGRDGVIRGAKLRAGNATLERAVQHLYPMELQCDDALEKEDHASQDMELNADAKEFRPRRDAAIAAKLRITDQMEDEDEEPVVDW